MKPATYLSLIVAVVVAGAAAAMWQGWFAPPLAGGADPADPKRVALGERVYAARCASCHGARLEGQADWRSRRPDGSLPAPPHDETGHTWHHADSQLFDMVTRGSAAYAVPGFRGTMPAYAAVLGDDEIWAVLAYIKSRWPATVRARQESINARMKRARGE